MQMYEACTMNVTMAAKAYSIRVAWNAVQSKTCVPAIGSLRIRQHRQAYTND
jgi:hypothetical protein